ncbi:hypothetical protein [Aquimarina aquimarini]|uniref:hypothetical protein n=1 Tax=Aquimarina aquimarini TaxID=1191734 RepID=UPI000D55C90F|nr:hypothetical protein [Aquimarina aquimarini]
MKKIIIFISAIVSILSCEELDIEIQETESTTIEQTDFNVVVLFDKQESYVNEYTSFNVNIQKKGNDNLTYKAYFTNVEGELKLPSEEETIIQNREFDISEGITFMEFKGTAIQNNEIEFVVEASNGIRKTQTIKYNTLPTDFEIIINPKKKSVSVWDAAQFSLSIIIPDVNQNLEYNIYFKGENSNAWIEIGNVGSGMTAVPGQIRPLGTNSHTFINIRLIGSLAAIEDTFTIVIIDSNGVERSEKVTVDFFK